MSEIQSNKDAARSLFGVLQDRGLFEYGSVIESEVVHDVLGIEMPDYASKQVFSRLAMIELAAIDYCRNVLLGQGKYLAGTPAGYRVLLPSENKTQIDSYMSSADRKLSRALKLSRNAPKFSDSSNQDQTSARIMIKRSSMRGRGPDDFSVNA